MLAHPHKRVLFELACPPGARHAGTIALSRWRAGTLHATAAPLAEARTEVVATPGHYEYADASAGLWHVNFADPRLFVAYGSRLLAQDELQAAEHPLLGSLREALLAEGDPATTENEQGPTPVLVAGVERRCTFATAPDPGAGRPHGLYGNRFASTPLEDVRRAVHVHASPSRSNLIIAAPAEGSGRYARRELERILVTACTGFGAAVLESQRLWPGAPVEVRTGFWGCAAFGGNRRAMTLLQILSARLAGVDSLRFYAFDRAGRIAFQDGLADLERVLAPGAPGEPLSDVLARIHSLRYEWGVGDGS